MGRKRNLKCIPGSTHLSLALIEHPKGSILHSLERSSAPDAFCFASTREMLRPVHFDVLFLPRAPNRYRSLRKTHLSRFHPQPRPSTESPKTCKAGSNTSHDIWINHLHYASSCLLLERKII
jgi:hypothetical protein